MFDLQYHPLKDSRFISSTHLRLRESGRHQWRGYSLGGSSSLNIMSSILRRAEILRYAIINGKIVRYSFLPKCIQNMPMNTKTRSTYMNAVEVAAQSAKVTANRAKIIVAMQLD